MARSRLRGAAYYEARQSTASPGHATRNLRRGPLTRCVSRVNASAAGPQTRGEPYGDDPLALRRAACARELVHHVPMSRVCRLRGAPGVAISGNFQGDSLTRALYSRSATEKSLSSPSMASSMNAMDSALTKSPSRASFASWLSAASIAPSKTLASPKLCGNPPHKAPWAAAK